VCRRTRPRKLCGGVIKTTGILATNLDGDPWDSPSFVARTSQETFAGSDADSARLLSDRVWFPPTSPLRLNWQPGRERPPGTEPGPGLGIEVGVAHVPAAVMTGTTGRHRSPPAYVTAPKRCRLQAVQE
jgi:hypothetical protein